MEFWAACGSNSLETVVLFCAGEGDIDGTNIDEGDERTALMVAASCHCDAVVEYLLTKGAQVGLVDVNHYTALHLAALFNSGRSRTVELLLQYGAEVNAATPAKGATPLHLAARMGNVRVVEALLAAPGVNVFQRDAEGRTPRDIAIVKKHGAVEERLLAAEVRDMALLCVCVSCLFLGTLFLFRYSCPI